MKQLLAALLIAILTAPAFASAQDDVFPLPADLYILTSERVLIRVDALTGGQTEVSPPDQPITDFDIAPDGAWYVYRTIMNNAVIVTELDGMSGYVLEFDAPPPPVTGQGQTIAWSPDASMIAYIVPDGVRIAQVSAGDYGAPIFETVEGGPWVDIRWDALDTLMLRDEAGTITALRLVDGQWTRGADSGGFAPDSQPVPSSLGSAGVQLANGDLVPGTAGALAYDWGPLPPPETPRVTLPADLAFLMAGEDGIAQVWWLPSESGTAQPITNEASAVLDYAIAPDGTQIAYCTAHTLIAASLDGTDRRELATLAPETANAVPDWSPDGTQISYTDRRGLWIVGADGSQPPRLIVQNILDPQDSDIGTIRVYNDPRWSPDGAHLLVTVGYYEGAVQGVVEIETGNITELTSMLVSRGAWTDDGRVLVWSAYYGHETPGLYLLDPANPDAAPVALLDEQRPTLDVLRGADGAWYALVRSTATMGPQYVQVLSTPSLDEPFTPADDTAGGAFLEAAKLAPPQGPPLVAAGLRNIRYNDVWPQGELVIANFTANTTAGVDTGGPVWNVQWSVPR